MEHIEDTYSFGIAGSLIWSTHIIIGAILAYIGYNIVNQEYIDTNWGILLVVVGVMAMFYHAHLWYLNLNSTNEERIH